MRCRRAARCDLGVGRRPFPQLDVVRAGYELAVGEFVLHGREETLAVRHLANKALVLDLVEWVASGPKPYSEVMDAWRTSCPRLTIWEDAVDLGLVAIDDGDRAGPVVRITDAGSALLDAERPG